jgi:hypothetical protein
MKAFSKGRRRGLMATTVAGLALALAGCGSNSPGIAHLPSNSKKPTKSSSSSGGSLGASVSPGGGSGGGPQNHAAIRMVGVSGANAIKFAACIRAHGVPDFPDPNAQGVFSLSGSDASLPKTPQFQRASKTCLSLLHLGGAPPNAAQRAQVLAQLLKYSQCMRAHGVTNFPDPQSHPGGGVSLSLRSANGIDPGSPIFQHAQTACASLQPGGPGGGP